jgi:hypothetical protein
MTGSSKDKKYSRELQDALDFRNSPSVRDHDGPYGNDNDGWLAKYMGKGYVFRMEERLPTGDHTIDLREHRID